MGINQDQKQNQQNKQNQQSLQNQQNKQNKQDQQQNANRGATVTVAISAEVEKFLKGMDFPANKQDLLRQAQGNAAPQDVLNLIKQMQDRMFNSPVDVSKEVGRIQ